jgi:hypothetical protein
LTIEIVFGRSVKLGSCVCSVSAGSVAATRIAAPSVAEIFGRARTRSRIHDQRRGSPGLLRRFARNGMRERYSLFPMNDITAGSTDSEPISATATISIDPTAIDVKMFEPVKSMPAIAIITVSPEMSTAWPEVEAAAISASRFERPFWCSSRARRM